MTYFPSALNAVSMQQWRYIPNVVSAFYICSNWIVSLLIPAPKEQS